MKRWLILLAFSVITITVIVFAQTSSERLKNNKRVIENEIANLIKAIKKANEVEEML